MEKCTPHSKLSVVKDMIQAGQVRIHFSALAGGAALGFDAEGIIGLVMALTTKDFYKSMTTHADHRIWQDVHHGQWSGAVLYIKFQWAGEYFVVSFKDV